MNKKTEYPSKEIQAYRKKIEKLKNERTKLIMSMGDDVESFDVDIESKIIAIEKKISKVNNYLKPFTTDTPAFNVPPKRDNLNFRLLYPKYKIMIGNKIVSLIEDNKITLINPDLYELKNQEILIYANCIVASYKDQIKRGDRYTYWKTDKKGFRIYRSTPKRIGNISSRAV